MNERGQWTSASKSAADELCPGRHLACLSLPEVTTPEAEFGNRVHAALCKGSPEGLTQDELISYESCMAKDIEGVQKYFGAHADKVSAIRETRLWMNFGPLKHSGQPDVVRRHGTKVLVTDYKSLFGDVQPVELNKQLRDLVVLVWENSVMVDEIAATIAQPGRPVELVIYHRDDFGRARADMQKRVAESNDPKAERRPGTLQCTYCRFKTKCEEYIAWANANKQDVIRVGVTGMDKWSPEQWRDFLDAAKIAAKLIADAEAKAKELLTANPQSIPGWTLEAGDVREKIVNPQECFSRFEKLGGSLDQFMRCVGITKKSLGEQLSAVTKKKGKELQSELKTLLAGITESKQNAPSLKRLP